MTTSGKETKETGRWPYAAVFLSQMSYILKVAIKTSQKEDWRSDGFVAASVFWSFVDCFGVDFFFFLMFTCVCAFFGGENGARFPTWLRGYSFLKMKAVPVLPERILSHWDERLELLPKQVGKEAAEVFFKRITNPTPLFSVPNSLFLSKSFRNITAFSGRWNLSVVQEIYMCFSVFSSVGVWGISGEVNGYHVVRRTNSCYHLQRQRCKFKLAIWIANCSSE